MTGPNAAPLADKRSRYNDGVWIPLLLGLAIPPAMILFAASPLGTDFAYVIIGIPILIIALATLAITSAVYFFTYMIKMAWKKAAIAAILPVIVISIVFNPLYFILSCNEIGGIIHFIAAKPFYDRKVAALPASVNPRLLVINWGGMIWASSGVVYDQTDQVMLPKGHQTPAWLAQADNNELSCDGYFVQPLWDHYYLADFPC